MGQPLVECSFLVPIHRDAEIADGQPHSMEIWDWLTDELFRQFSGRTLAPGLYDGVWKSPQGSRIPDQSRKYIVAVPKRQVRQLRRLLVEACDVFQQQAIYLSVGGQVEFIKRLTDDGTS